MANTSAAVAQRIKGGSFLIESRTPDEVFTPEDITDEHRLIAQTAQEFIDQEIVPRLNEIEEKKPGVLRELLKKAAELGLCATDVPQRFGGLELDKISSILVAERMARDGSWATTVGAQAGIGILPIAFFGTEEQKAKYLPKLASAEWVGAYSLSEASSASDALNCKTRATLDPDGKALPPERHQDVGHQRRHRRRLRGLCQSGRREIHRLYCGAELCGSLARRGRAQDGNSRLLHNAAQS